MAVLMSVSLLQISKPVTADVTQGAKEAGNAAYVLGQAIVAFYHKPTDEDATPEERLQAQTKMEDEVEQSKDVTSADVLTELSRTVIGQDGDLMIMQVCSDTLTTEQIIAMMEKRDDVCYAEPNYIVHAASADHTDLQYNAIGENSIEMEGWNTYDGEGNPTPSVNTDEIVVAVVDSGVDYMHEDLKNVMWDQGLNYPELVAMGGGKYGINVCSVNNHGFPYDSQNVMDDFEHGTHVAGIIAAQWNGIGVSGLVSGAKIMAVKSMNNNGSNTIVESIKAYDYIIKARDAGVNVRVVNNSWHDNVFGHTMDLLVREAGEKGILSAFAAGNRELEIDNKDILSVSFYNNPYAVIVGGTDQNGNAANFSNYSKKLVDVFAPGGYVYSTFPRFKGKVSENAVPYEKDGIVYEMNYPSDATLQDGHVEGLIGFSADEEVFPSSLSEETVEGVGKLLCVSCENEYSYESICSDVITGLGDIQGGYLDVYIEEDDTDVSISCFNPDYDTERGNDSDHNKLSKGLHRLGFTFYEHTLSKDLAFRMDIGIKKNGENVDRVLIKGIGLTTDIEAYSYDSGTSMATPAVAAEAAALFAAFDEGADKIKARILGSVNEKEVLKGKCVSGGMVSAKKALAGDTVPVLFSCSVSGNEISVGGFFFGSEPGSLTIDGEAVVVQSWSEEAITARFAKEPTIGEHVIEVTSKAGKKGHRYEILTKSPALAKRLPLPGRSLSGDPGTYAVTSNAYDQSFYGIEMKSLVGYDGYLYAFCKSRDQKTTVFAYDIEKKSWGQVYHGDYAAESGVCTWKNKILFLANDETKEISYLGVFDPKTKTAQYHLINADYCETGRSMINTGQGVYVVGGEYHREKTDPDTDYILGVRKLDETIMQFTELQRVGEDKTFIIANSLGVAYEDPNTLYLFGGNDSNGDINVAYQIRISGNTCELKVLNPADKPLIPGAALEQGASMQAVSLADGIMFSGRVAQDENSRVTADTFFAPYGSVAFKPWDTLISETPVYSVDVTAYRDMYYALGITYSEVGGHVFAAFPVHTKPQPGEMARCTVTSSGNGKLDRDGAFESYIGANETFKLLPQTGNEVTSVLVDGKESLTKEKLAEANKNGSLSLEILSDAKIVVTFGPVASKDPKDTEEPKTRDAFQNAGEGVGMLSPDGKILSDTEGKEWKMTDHLTASDLKKGLSVAVKNGGKYKIQKVTKKKGKVTGAVAVYMAPYDRNASKLTVPDTFKINGVSVKVTEIQNSAFSGCKNLKRAVIGKNIKKIGKKAFFGCGKLSDIRIRSRLLQGKRVGTKAFGKINAKAKVKVPAKKKKAYQKWLSKKGLPKRAKVR